MKASNIYMDIAVGKLEGSQLPTLEHLDLLKESDMEKVDRHVDIACLMQAAVDGIVMGLLDQEVLHHDFDYLFDFDAERIRIEMNGEDYKRYLLYDGEERGDLPTDITQFRRRVEPENAPRAFTDIVYDTLVEMHDHWRKMHTNLFSTNDGRQFMFMPVDMIGWEEVEKYYDILEPILLDLGINSAYTKDEVRTRYQGLRNLNYRNVNLEHIKRCISGDKTCSDIIRKKLKNDSLVLDKIAEQIMENAS